jgi:rSAM/selenodomain-associated transferase 1
MAVRPVSARVVLMTKMPQPGQVKTRLIPALGPDGAAALHRAMLLDTLTKITAAGLPCTVAIAGSLAHPLVEQFRSQGLAIEQQVGADLGARLHHALRGSQDTIALGADCVCFQAQWLQAAATHQAPVRIGPADDGGYWAIAISPQARSVVFEEIDWSTDQVHRQTICRAQAAGLAVHALPACYDIDRPEDLQRLNNDPRCPPRTKAVLNSLLS